MTPRLVLPIDWEPRFSLTLNCLTASEVLSPYLPSTPSPAGPKSPRSYFPRSASACCTIRTAPAGDPRLSVALPRKTRSMVGSGLPLGPMNRGEVRFGFCAFVGS